jgi:uncharacterized protein (TIGR02118 family)
MIRVGVFYPQGESTKFDMKYYMEKHTPMVQQKMGAALKGVAIDKGISGGMPGSSMTYVVICNLLFDSIDAFQVAFAPHAEAIMGDISNYTNVQPVVQISEVKI